MNDKTRPLVTIALIAYNQEKLVAEAAFRLLNQTYEPLEIILSDDCSTDNTFAVLKKITDEYKGQHKVILRKTEKNSGICGHINSLWSMAKGEWFFIAAGDDLSEENRVEKIMEYVKANPEVTLVQTYIRLIDEAGNHVGENKHGVFNEINDKKSWNFQNRLAGGTPSTHGSCFSYHRKIFDLFGPMPSHAIYEDNIINWRSEMVGYSAILPLFLVSSRVHAGQTTYIGLKDGVRHFDQKRIRLIKDGILTTQQNKLDLEKCDSENLVSAEDFNLMRRWLDERESYFKMRASAMSWVWPLRIVALLSLFLKKRHAAFSKDNIYRSLLPKHIYYFLKSRKSSV